MPEQTSSQDKAAIFKIFEASLSSEQRQILLKHPDLLSPELVNQLYQASLERISAQHIEPGFTCRDMGIDDDGEVTPKKPRKMVNSWMAFRSYYSPLIKDLPQKVRSPMLALLWKNDVDHGLWELLSAAFSYIRDSHTEDSVSIDQFLLVAAQIVPIIPADQYFTRNGWIRAGGVLERVEVCPRELPKATNVSCAGLVRYCFRQGLISKAPTIDRDSSRSTTMHRAYPSAISFAAPAPLPLVLLSSLSEHQAVMQNQNLVNVRTEALESLGADADSYEKDTGIDGSELAPFSAAMKPNSGMFDQTNEEIAAETFPLFQDTDISAAVHVASMPSKEQEFWIMDEDLSDGCCVPDDMWSTAG